MLYSGHLVFDLKAYNFELGKVEWFVYVLYIRYHSIRLMPRSEKYNPVEADNNQWKK